jgi:hypothetical protein
MHTRRADFIVALVGAVACACSSGDTDDGNIARGRGLKPLAMEPASEASAIDAAVRASFDVGPELVLLAHPRRLARFAGYGGGDPLPDALLESLHARGVVRGRCEPKHEAPRDTPRCAGSAAGYVVRMSEPFRVAGDTIQLNFAAEQFAPATGARPQALRFEKIYQLVGRGSAWRVVREARVREAG